MCQILLFPVSMWFPISLVCCSRIASQLLRLFPSSFSTCTGWMGISCLLFLYSIGEFSARSCSCHRLSCLEVTRGLRENGRNFSCNVGATQPIGIFLPPPSCKSTQLCRFEILLPSPNPTPLCVFGIFNSFRYGTFNGSPPFPPSSPQSFPSLFRRVVCRHRMCRVNIRGKGFYLTQFRRNAIFKNPCKCRGFSPGYPPFLNLRLLSHHPLLPSSYPTLRLSVLAPLPTHSPCSCLLTFATSLPSIAPIF